MTYLILGCLKIKICSKRLFLKNQLVFASFQYIQEYIYIYTHTIQSFRYSWLFSTTRKTITCKLSRWKKLSSPYREQWPLEQNCSEHCFMIFVIWACRHQNLWFCSPVFLLTAAPLQTQLFLKLIIFIQDLQWPAFFRLSGPQRKDQICVLYIERKKKKRCL